MLAETIVAIIFSLIIMIIGIVVGISQLFVMFKTQNTSGTSLITYIIFLVGPIFCLCWSYIYFLSHMSSWWAQTNIPLVVNQLTIVPMIITYTMEVVGGSAYVCIKVKHIKLAKKYKISEIELSKVLLSKFKNNKEKYRSFIIVVVVAAVLALGSSILLMVFTNPAINPGAVGPDAKKVLPAIITLSFIGAALWEAMSWPQFIKCVKTRDTSGISLTWAIFMPISCVICLIYAAMLASTSGQFTLDTIGAIVFNGVLVNVGIMIIKLINRTKAKQLGITELEYTNRYINSKNKKRA